MEAYLEGLRADRPHVGHPLLFYVFYLFFLTLFINYYFHHVVSLKFWLQPLKRTVQMLLGGFVSPDGGKSTGLFTSLFLGFMGRMIMLRISYLEGHSPFSLTNFLGTNNASCCEGFWSWVYEK